MASSTTTTTGTDYTLGEKASLGSLKYGGAFWVNMVMVTGNATIRPIIIITNKGEDFTKRTYAAIREATTEMVAGLVLSTAVLGAQKLMKDSKVFETLAQDNTKHASAMRGAFDFGLLVGANLIIPVITNWVGPKVSKLAKKPQVDRTLRAWFDSDNTSSSSTKNVLSPKPTVAESLPAATVATGEVPSPVVANTIQPFRRQMVSAGQVRGMSI